MIGQRHRQLVAQEQLGRHGLRIGRVGQHDCVQFATHPVYFLRRAQRPAAPGQPDGQQRGRGGRYEPRQAAARRGHAQADKRRQPQHGGPEGDAGRTAPGDLGGRFLALAEDLDPHGLGELVLGLDVRRLARALRGDRVGIDHVLHLAQLAAGPLLVLLLPARLAFAAADQVEFAVQRHHDGEFLRQHHFGLIVLAQIVARVVRQHHVDAAQRVVQRGGAVARFQPVTHEGAAQREHAVIEQRDALRGLGGPHQEWLHQRLLLGAKAAQRLAFPLELAQCVLVAAAARHVGDGADDRPGQDDEHQPDADGVGIHCRVSSFLTSRRIIAIIRPEISGTEHQNMTTINKTRNSILPQPSFPTHQAARRGLRPPKLF